MKYLVVKNWTEFQHYRDRCPPWIKLYNTLLDNYEFIELPETARGHLVMLWLVASRHVGRIPYDLKYLARAIHAKSRIDIPRLVEAGFLSIVEQDASTAAEQNASTGLAECAQNASPHAYPPAHERESTSTAEQTPLPAREPSPAEAALNSQCGEHYPAVARFLDERPPARRAEWAADLLRLMGPATGNLPEDLARACTDGALADPPVTNARTLRIFVASSREERLRGIKPAASARPSAEFVTPEARRWAAEQDAKEAARV